MAIKIGDNVKYIGSCYEGINFGVVKEIIEDRLFCFRVEFTYEDESNQVLTCSLNELELVE